VILKLINPLSEPFERLIVDCVGWLAKSKTKSGYRYVLPIMCCPIYYPKAIPLPMVKVAITLVVK